MECGPFRRREQQWLVKVYEVERLTVSCRASLLFKDAGLLATLPSGQMGIPLKAPGKMYYLRGHRDY
jgi:hypothetical protein